jgi:ribonuclease HI
VKNHSGATGAVLRNNQGIFLGASTTFIPHVLSTSMAEALAMLHGLTLANSLGYTNIEAKSDSLKVVNLCTGVDRIWKDATVICANIFIQAANIGKVEFMHCRRDINKVAHELARSYFMSSTGCNWVDEPPSFLLEKLLNDVTEF